MAERLTTLGAVGEVLRSAGLLEGLRGPGDVAVRGVSQDSRSVRPGDLFLAWRGTTVDAHDFVASAAASGASAAVVERPVHVDLPQVVFGRAFDGEPLVLLRLAPFPGDVDATASRKVSAGG